MSLKPAALQDAKAGRFVFVTKFKDLKTGKLKDKNGRIIWDGKDFVFFPEKEKY